MNRVAFDNAKPLVSQKDAIDGVQAKIAVTGTKVKIEITSEGNVVTVNEVALIAALGTSNYNTLIAAVKTSVNSAITSAETAVDTALAAL